MFGDTFTPEYIESLIQETNAFYGGKNIDVDNVVFVHGSDDPWHPMGRLTDVNENSPAFVIDGKKNNYLVVQYRKNIYQTLKWLLLRLFTTFYNTSPSII